MALKDQPYFPMYIQDILTDEKLIECDANAHGVYLRLMCVLHKQEDYGKLKLKSKYDKFENEYEAFTKLLQRQMPFTTEEIERGIDELEHNGVIQIKNRVLSQKRMVRDGNTSFKRAQAGSIGGKISKKLSKSEAKVKQITETEDESTSVNINNSVFNNMEGRIFRNMDVGGMYKQYCKERKKSLSLIVEEVMLKNLKKISNDNPAIAIKIIQKSLVGNYPDFYELKENNNKSSFVKNEKKWDYSKREPESKKQKYIPLPSPEDRKVGEEAISEILKKFKIGDYNKAKTKTRREARLDSKGEPRQ